MKRIIVTLFVILIILFFINSCLYEEIDMSGSIIHTPAVGADWPDAWQQVEYSRKGMLGLSLTNYDALTLPQIASGSWAEVAGSIYKWTANDTISGSPSSGNINYIKLVPGGSGESAYVTPTWEYTTAPTWSDVYQGWYDGTSRYVAGCYYDGTNYPLKWVYTNRHAGPVSRSMNLSLVGGAAGWDTATTTTGQLINFNAAGTSDFGYIPVNFGGRLGLVTALKTNCSAYTAGSVTIDLRNDDTSTATTMATTTHSGTGDQSDTTITDPIIDEVNNHYYIRIDPAATTTLYVREILIEWTEIIRC